MSTVATVVVIFLSILGICFRKGPLNWPVVGMIPWMVWHSSNIFEDGCKLVLEHGGTFIVRGPWLLRSNLFQVVTFSPNNVEYILKENFSIFPKGPNFKEVFFHTFGDGIFTSDDQLWKRQRKPTVMAVSSSTFKDRNLSLLQKALQQKLLPFLEEAKEEKASVDLQHVLLEFTTDNFFMAIFGKETGSRTFALAFDEATECCVYRFLCPSFIWKLMRFFNVGFEKRSREAEAIVEDSVAELVKARVKSWRKVMNCRETYYPISSNWKEIKDALLLNICKMGTFGREELRNMNYLQAALSESMRLYPPIPAVFREPTIDNVLPDGTHVKKGTKCLVFFYATNRMESIWGKDTLEFKPERWISKEGVCVNQSDYKYPVFIAGPRICPGIDLAYVNMKCIVANILARYRIKVEAGHQVKPKLGISLFMKHGLKVTLHARNDILS